MSTEEISSSDVRHIARLSRLGIDDAQLEAFKQDLRKILDHVSTIQTLDVEGVEEMVRPHNATNRLDVDEPSLPIEPGEILALAPATEGPYIAVPKVLDEGSA